MKFVNIFLSGAMRQPIKLQPVMRCSGYLAALTAMGLAVGLIVVPLDAAARRLVPVPRSRPATLGARSSAPPAAASPNRDQKQPSQTDDAVREGPGYECRNRNGAASGKLSAHAVGKAIDISGFELSSGKFIPIKPDGDETMRNVVDTVRTAACGWFTTVLGPGADAAHADHLHVDMAPHGTSDRYRICQ